ncbi:MAG TPA: hypothetical protein VMH02_06165 [Verrucomicrobiae bacterium]|nr:hypothetical protein [Verrucomicrobiae bacterium]
MAVFLPYYAAALALLYLELRGARPRAIALPRLSPAIWTGVLLLAFAGQLACFWHAAQAAARAEPWRAALPIGVAVANVPHAQLVAGTLLALALVQSFALLALHRAPPSRGLVVAGSAALFALALAAPAFVSPDPYAYVGDALLGVRSYAPPAQPFAGAFGLVNRLFGAPMLPSPYGPLWTACATLVTAAFGSLLGKLFALRLFGLGCVLALLAALRAFGVPRRVVALVALNPAIALEYVAGAHNDALGLAALAVAAVLVRRSAVLASATIAIAGLVKLPFVVLGLPLLAAIEPRARRYACAISAAVVALGVSWWSGGAAYFGGLAVHVPVPGPAYPLNVAVAFFALCAIGIAFLGGPRLRSALWLIAMASSYVATWYLFYGAPYALARRRLFAYLAIALPFADALLDAKFMQWWTSAIVLPLVVACSFTLARRRPRPRIA